MAAKGKSGGTVDIKALARRMILRGKGALTDDEYSMLDELYRTNESFRNWFDSERGSSRSGIGGYRKSTYEDMGYSPMPKKGQGGEGTQEMIRRSGKRTNQRGQWSDVDIKEKTRRGRKEYLATPIGGRTRTAAEMASVIRRGMSGATMNMEDQRIFDKWRTMQRDAADKAAEDEANREMARKTQEEYAKRRAEQFQYLGMKDDGTLNDMQISELVSQREARNKTNEELYRQGEIEKLKARLKAQQEAEAEAKWRKANNIDPNDVVSDYERKQINDGSKAWGYSPEDQRAIDALKSRLEGIYRDTAASKEDRARLEKEYHDYLRRVKKGLIDNPDGPTVEQMYGKAYRDENGVLWGKNSKGELVKLDEPKESAEDKAARAAEERAEEREEKRRQALSKERREWIGNRANQYGNFDAKNKRDLSYADKVAMARKDAYELFGPSEDDNGNIADLGIEEGGEEVASPSAGICPECGEPLDGNGNCASCGYPNNGAAEEASPSQPQAFGHVKNSYL